MFKVQCTIAGIDAVLTWDAGAISSDDPSILGYVVDEAKRLAKKSTPVGPPCGPYRTKKYLGDATIAYHLLLRLSRNVVVVDGAVNPMPSVPPGAVV